MEGCCGEVASEAWLPGLTDGAVQEGAFTSPRLAIILPPLARPKPSVKYTLFIAAMPSSRSSLLALHLAQTKQGQSNAHFTDYQRQPQVNGKAQGRTGELPFAASSFHGARHTNSNIINKSFTPPPSCTNNSREISLTTCNASCSLCQF